MEGGEFACQSHSSLPPSESETKWSVHTSAKVARHRDLARYGFQLGCCRQSVRLCRPNRTQIQNFFFVLTWAWVERTTIGGGDRRELMKGRVDSRGIRRNMSVRFCPATQTPSVKSQGGQGDRVTWRWRAIDSKLRIRPNRSQLSTPVGEEALGKMESVCGEK